MSTTFKGELEAMRKRGMISAAEAARRFGVSRSTVWRWMDSGRIAGERVSWRRYVSEESMRKAMGDLGPIAKDIAPDLRKRGRGGHS
jgi:excisionase family DNA binding protein